ncbi:hypothetical protein Bca101_043398 [Brassica carinata]
MANNLVFLSDLQTGRSSSSVQVRLLRFWEARNVRRGGELMGVDMLLLDSQATMLPATISVHRLETHRSNLKEGLVYSLTGFDVAQCNPNYRLSDSSLLIRFNDSTSFKDVADLAAPIPLESFRFHNHSEMLGLANTNHQLPDLIGEITAVKSTVTNHLQDKNRVMATIKMENGTSVTMSLFDAQAVSIHNQLEMLGDPRVVVATSINPKMVGGSLFLNATSGTHVYFDKETSAGESLFNRLVEQDTGVRPAARLLRSFGKVEELSIAELNNFVLTAPSQDIDFICNGRVTEIKMDKGWCYVSCSSCAKKLQSTVSSLTCVSCNNPNAVGVLRYRVEMSVADETGEGVFVCFDGVMTKLHNMRAYEAGHRLSHSVSSAQAGDGVNPEEAEAPPFVKEIEGKTYKFQVRVSPYNFTENHQTFTISRIISEGDRLPHPENDDNGGDDDNGDDNDGGTSKIVNEEAGGSSSVDGTGRKVKKARKA